VAAAAAFVAGGARIQRLEGGRGGERGEGGTKAKGGGGTTRGSEVN